MFKKIILAASLLLIATSVTAEEYRATEIIAESASSVASQAMGKINDVANNINVAVGEFIVAAPYIPSAIEKKYKESKYERDFKKCEEPELEAGKAIKKVMQTEYTVLWCEETYGAYVNNWRKPK